MSIPTRRNVELFGRKNYVVTSDGEVYSHNGKKMFQAKTKLGYMTIRVQKNLKRKKILVHRIVANAFVEGKTKERRFVNHKNGVKSDNRAENLEWCTPKENIRHAHATGLCNPRSGEIHQNAKLKNSEAKFVRDSLREKDTDIRRKKLAALFSVSTSVIGEVARGRTYRLECCGEPVGNKKKYLSKDQVVEIKKLLKEAKLSQNKIAKIFGVTHPTVWKISKNIRHKE